MQACPSPAPRGEAGTGRRRGSSRRCSDSHRGQGQDHREAVPWARAGDWVRMCREDRVGTLGMSDRSGHRAGPALSYQSPAPLRRPHREREGVQEGLPGMGLGERFRGTGGFSEWPRGERPLHK